VEALRRTAAGLLPPAGGAFPAVTITRGRFPRWASDPTQRDAKAGLPFSFRRLGKPLKRLSLLKQAESYYRQKKIPRASLHRLGPGRTLRISGQMRQAKLYLSKPEAYKN